MPLERCTLWFRLVNAVSFLLSNTIRELVAIIEDKVCVYYHRNFKPRFGLISWSVNKAFSSSSIVDKRSTMDLSSSIRRCTYIGVELIQKAFHHIHIDITDDVWYDILQPSYLVYPMTSSLGTLRMSLEMKELTKLVELGYLTEDVALHVVYPFLFDRSWTENTS